MEGEIRQIGSPGEVFARPNSIEVAAFIGSPPMNLLKATLTDGVPRLGDVTLDLKVVDGRSSGQVVIGIRPSAVRLESEGMPARVDLVENLGDTAILDIAFAGTTVRARVSDPFAYGEGDQVFMRFDPKDIH